MDFLDLLLGREGKRRREELPGILRLVSRWMIGCGCLMLAAVIGGVILLLAGIISFGQDAATVIIVVITIIVAIASLIRSSLGY
jgi:hypothetical protein